MWLCIYDQTPKPRSFFWGMSGLPTVYHHIGRNSKTIVYSISCLEKVFLICKIDHFCNCYSIIIFKLVTLTALKTKWNLLGFGVRGILSLSLKIRLAVLTVQRENKVCVKIVNLFFVTTIKSFHNKSVIISY